MMFMIFDGNLNSPLFVALTKESLKGARWWFSPMIMVVVSMLTRLTLTMHDEVDVDVDNDEAEVED